MKISLDTVEELREFFSDNLEEVTELINFSRDKLGEVFGEEVDLVEPSEVEEEFERLLEDEDLALNLAALYKLGVGIEVSNDYAGFVVDELIGRQIASQIAGADPEGTLAEATFHYIDVHTGEVLDDSRNAGYDDVMAGLAAGFQSRLPGWSWQENGFDG
ncbi:MAG: hypothetical protein ABEK59_11500 [Halobacteria archaeon]